MTLLHIILLLLIRGFNKVSMLIFTRRLEKKKINPKIFPIHRCETKVMRQQFCKGKFSYMSLAKTYP
jgi:hypothetical protein